MNDILSSMHSAQWYDHFRGALYPLNLDAHKVNLLKKKTVKSLLQIAADFIVQDSTTTLHAISILPQELYDVLMKQAVEANRDRSVNVLLTKWPHSTLTLKAFAPNIFSDMCLLHDHLEVTRVAKQGLRYTTCVAHNFLETLKKKSATRLKFVDLTGYPTAEVITYYIATHTMLAHNEARQNMMIHKYEEAIKLLPTAETPTSLERFTADHSLPDDKFIVKLDAFLTSEHALYEVCKALKVSSFRDSNLKLYVEKLDATCLGEPKVKILLEQLNAEHLKGLRLKYNSISSDDFIDLSPSIALFPLISSLDLSCNCINIYQNDTACDEMGKMFASLPVLVRLDLSNNRLKSKLNRVLSPVKKPLQFLRLAGCGLTFADMTYLATSHHTKGLTELDLSENGLWNTVVPLIHLLRNIQQQICVLELEDSGLTDTYMESLILSSCLKHFASLMYLNLSGNSVSDETLCSVCENVASLTFLQFLCVSYPKECYSLESSEAQVRYKSDAEARLEEVIYKERREKLGSVDMLPKLVLSDLDQDMETV